jgi:1-acyl-sn-glycerol-3-phosphate acyltransferase
VSELARDLPAARPRIGTIARRLVTLPGFALAFLLWLAAAPLWIPLALAADLARGGGAVAIRSAGFLLFFLACEMAGLVAGATLWLVRPIGRWDDARWREIHYRLQDWWGSTLFRGVCRAFSLGLELEGEADLARGPYLLMLRHASSGDTLLASALIGRPHAMRLRYVLKRELLWDPCLDVVGNRLPHLFVDRQSEDSDLEVERVAALGRDLGPKEGVLIYPEGTRFSAAKRERVIARFESQGSPRLRDYARSLRHVLPPRPRGALALLDAAPAADVVLCAHSGFEGAASLGQIWRGGLVRRTIHVRFQRVPRAEIPRGFDERAAWLREQWRRIDAWVGAAQGRLDR